MWFFVCFLLHLIADLFLCWGVVKHSFIHFSISCLYGEFVVGYKNHVSRT